MPKRIVTLGEIMLRLSPPGHQKFEQAGSFDITYGGGEANVAASLSNYGLQAAFVSKVPGNAIGQAAINHLRRYGVDTKFILRGGDRLGIYYLESGASVRASQVIYDRAGSAIATADKSEFDFDEIFEGADWFHTSGITPALGDAAAALAKAALKAAKEKGITTSMDLNYRKKLWSREKAKTIMTGLYEYVDVCIGIEEYNEDQQLTNDDGTVSIEAFQRVLARMKEQYGFRYIVSSVREHVSADNNLLSAILYDGEHFYQTGKYDVSIVDRVGTGDSFASGIIYGLVTGLSLNETAQFAIAASALKHTIPGDFSHASVADIAELMSGKKGGKINR